MAKRKPSPPESLDQIDTSAVERFRRPVEAAVGPDVEVVVGALTAAAVASRRRLTALSDLLATGPTPALEAAMQATGPDIIVKFLFTSGSTKAPKAVINTQRMKTARSRFTPDTPTYAEQGFPELTMREWYGLFMPGRVTAAVAQRANAAVRSALAAKEMIDFGVPLGLEVVASASPEDFGRTFKADSDLWGPFVRKIGFTAES